MRLILGSNEQLLREKSHLLLNQFSQGQAQALNPNNYLVGNDDDINNNPNNNNSDNNNNMNSSALNTDNNNNNNIINNNNNNNNNNGFCDSNNNNNTSNNMGGVGSSQEIHSTLSDQLSRSSLFEKEPFKEFTSAKILNFL